MVAASANDWAGHVHVRAPLVAASEKVGRLACVLATFKLRFIGRQRDSALPRSKAAAVETADSQTTTEQPTNQMTEATTQKAHATTTKKGTPVPADQILVIMTEMEGQPADVVAQACGYFTEVTNNATGDVEIRVTAADNSAFLLAAMNAKGGPVISAPVRSNRRTNRSPIVKIGKLGNIVVGGRHTSIAGFPFGEEVDSRVRIESEPGKITIYAAAPSEYESQEDSIDDDSELDLL